MCPQGCSQVCWSSSARAQHQAALPRFWLLLLLCLLLNFSHNLFLLPIFDLFIICRNPTAAWLPQGVPSPNRHRIWGCYGDCLLWQETEFAVASVTAVGPVANLGVGHLAKVN